MIVSVCTGGGTAFHANPQHYAHNVRDPVVEISAAVESRLDEFNGAAKAEAPMKTGSNPKRPVRASGKASAAKAAKCTNLSLPSGAGGGASMSQSIAIVRVIVTISVRGMSRYLRIRRGVSEVSIKGKRRVPISLF